MTILPKLRYNFVKKRDKMAIAIFGGSFDPPHQGHVDVVKAALRQLPAEKVYVVPAFVNPFKEKTCAPGELRLKWLKTIFDDEPKVHISDFEIRQQRPVPTIETVRHFRKEDPMVYLVIGADNLDSLSQWKNFEALDTLVTWVVATRKGFESAGMLRQLDVDIDISSTQLRRNEQTHLIPEPVRREIENYYKELECKHD